MIFHFQKFLKISFSIFFLLSYLNSSDIPINFRHITVEGHGLSESTVYDVFQDSRGYIWISTDNGLNKYDGYSMKSYQYMHNDQNSISEGAPRTIFEDMDGNIWISTNQGLVNKLDPDTENFIRINPIDLPNVEINGLVDIDQLPDGRMVAKQESYIMILDKNGKNLKNIITQRDSSLSESFYENLFDLTVNDNLINKISNPGNSDDLTKSFTMKEADSVLIVMLGEFDLATNGKYDFGWIEDENGKKIWSPWDMDTTLADHAGGSPFNRLAIDKFKLDRGNYKLRFISDALHSTDLWIMPPPDHPEYCGIGVYKIQDKAKITREKNYYDDRLKWNASDLEVNEDGTIWIANKTGMVLFDPDKGVIERFKTKYKNGLIQMIEDPFKNNYIWCLGSGFENSTQQGLARFNRSTGMFKYYDIDPDKSDEFIFNPVGLEFMKEDEIWLYSSNEGILRFNIKSGTTTRLVSEKGNNNALRDNNINFLYLDKGNAMWVSTSRMGISVYDPYYQKFSVLPYAQGQKNSFPEANVSIMGEDNEKNIFFVNNYQLHRYNPKDNEMKVYNDGLSSDVLLFDFDIVGSKMFQYARLKNKSWNLAIIEYDLIGKTINNTWIHDPKNKNSVMGSHIQDLILDKRAILWTSHVTVNTINAKIPGTDIFIKPDTDLTIFSDDKFELARFIQKVSKYTQGYQVRSLFEDKEGIVWLGAQRLLFKVDVENKVIDTYNHEPGDSLSLPSGLIVSMSEDSRNNLWLGTWPTGMVKFDKKSGKAKRFFEEKDGLIDNTVCGIMEDDDGYLWISTKNGVCRYNPVEDKFLDYYYAEDGLQSNEFLFDGAMKSSDGTIYLGGSNGVTYFQPEKIYKNPHPPLVDIYSVKKDGIKQVLNLNSDDPSELKVTHKNRGISFEFNALNYTRTEKNRYRYRMVGYDPDWIDAGDRRFTSYTNLPPGDYLFQVTGSNNDGLWNEKPAEVQVSVFPPPWATWWAYVIYLFLISTGIYLYLQYVKDRNKRENEELRKTEELELARQFQLDLLPSYIPRLPEYEIAAKIDTATEVGGDYYDFFEQNDGSIYLVTGDATGHGMTAGMMVSITKAGLHGISQPDTKDIMNQLNTVIKNIDLGQNRMALNIGHLKNGSVEFSSAGMPPLYMYNSKEKKLKEILQVGLPLGSLKAEDYKSDVYDFNSGDVMIFLSDGLPEATNVKGEMLGYEAVYNCMLDNIEQDPQTLLDTLSKLGTDWIRGTQLDDDITLMIVRKN